MEERFPLGQSGGGLTVREEGPRVLLAAWRPDDGRGLYKAYLLGAGGGRMLLGTLMPEEGKLALRRTMTRSELERKGCWPVAGGTAELAYSFQQSQSRPDPPGPPEGWRREGAPERMMGDQLLRRSAAGMGGAMIRREGDGFALALPYGTGTAFPMTPLFCFARLERLGDGYYVVYHFNHCGCPILKLGE